MRKIFLFLSLVFLAAVGLASQIGFALATCDDGCTDGASCVGYGDVVTHGALSYYCDFNTDGNMVLIQQKTTGDCLNDFECVDGYSCLDGICTNAYNYFIQGYNALLANVSGLCFNENGGWFCSNTTSLANATNLSKSCSFAGANAICYQCNSPLYYNQSIDRCISGICSSSPGCMSNSSIDNASIGGDYCASGQNCFVCDEDFNWNATENRCKMKECTSSPGCMNVTNLTNANVVYNRYCSTGTCFTCRSCYVWNTNSSSCVYSPSCNVGAITWSNVPFTNAELSSGTYKMLNVYDRVNLSFEGRSYWLGILGIETSRIVFKIEPIVSSYNLFTANNAQFDLNNNGMNDLRVSLAGISGGRANISIKFLTEIGSDNPNSNNNPGGLDNPNPNPNVDVNQNQTNPIDVGSSNGMAQDFVKKYVVAIIIIGVIFIILLVILIVYLVKKPKKVAGNTNPQPAQQQSYGGPGNAPGGYPVGGFRPIMQQPNNMPRRM